jgi:hypothetical protein
MHEPVTRVKSTWPSYRGESDTIIKTVAELRSHVSFHLTLVEMREKMRNPMNKSQRHYFAAAA